MKIFIIAWILCSEFDRGTSTPSSTSTAATLPMPGFSYLVSSSSWWLWRCFLGEVNVAYISDGMREQRKPGGTIHLPWVEVNTGYISWVGQIVYAFVDLMRVAGTFTFTFSSKLSLFWPTNQSFSAAMERWGWRGEEFAKSVKRNFPTRSCQPNQLVLKSVLIGWKYYLHLIWTVEKEFLRD